MQLWFCHASGLATGNLGALQRRRVEYNSPSFLLRLFFAFGVDSRLFGVIGDRKNLDAVDADAEVDFGQDSLYGRDGGV